MNTHETAAAKIWGWKDIATALGRSVKTVWRYTRLDHSDPKRLRVQSTAGRVWVYPSELTRWREANTRDVLSRAS